MNNAAVSFFGFTVLAIVIQALFALFEMSCVSFNKMRLQYYASQNQKRAIWLTHLIERPSRLFGTTLIGITASLQFGSECARRFYEAIGFNPDLAPLSQVVLVVIFGELVPMFAARRHPEQLAMALSPLMVLIYRILSPVIWCFDLVAKGVFHLIGKSGQVSAYLSREEVQKAFEEGEQVRDEFNSLVAKVFRMKNLLARQTITPLSSLPLIDSTATVSDARQLLNVRYSPFIPIFHRHSQNIVAIAYLRDLLNADDKKKLLDIARPPWFVTQDASLLQILDQFRRNNQSLAVILDAGGQACGVLSLDQIIDSIFGPEQFSSTETEKGKLYVERTVAGGVTMEQFNRDFQVAIVHQDGETLSDWIVRRLNHPPAIGEVLEMGPYELTVIEPTLRGVKSVSVKTID